jgi:ABC-type multidrug transport system fused ATPase/permease subunit
VLTVGQFTAFFTYAVLVTWPMRRIGQLVTRLGMTKVAIDRLSQILDEIEEIDEGNDDKLQPLKGEIEFRNVSFSYEGSDTDVINDISFTVKPGEKIALLGPTGAGKSTIIALLTRFYEPDSGEIFIDGRNIKEYSKHFLRKRIGVVLQKPFLFSRTIRDNIAYGSPESDLESIIESAKAAGIHDIIMEVFPEGYETVVGEKGVTLSGGQKQRITLARTVLNSPDVLILDDSTSSVDTQTEFRIQKALGSKMEGKTTLVIAHRISSVHDSDRIIIIDKGRIVEMGTHEELIGRNGFYRSIYEIQSSLSGEDGLSKGEIETSMAEKLLYNK